MGRCTNVLHYMSHTCYYVSFGILEFIGFNIVYGAKLPVTRKILQYNPICIPGQFIVYPHMRQIKSSCNHLCVRFLVIKTIVLTCSTNTEAVLFI